MTPNNSSQPSQSASSKKVDHRGSLSSYQIYVLVVLSIIGAPLLNFPRFVATEAGADGVWLSVISGLLVTGFVFMVSKLCQRFTGQTFVQFIPEIFETKRMKWFGKGIASLIIIGFALYWMNQISFQVRLFSEATNTTLLPKTPIEVTIITLLLASTLASYSRPAVIGMLNELLFPIILIPFALQLYVVFKKGDWVHIFPLFQSDWKGLCKGILSNGLGFSGFEVLFLIMGYSQKVDHSSKVNTRAMLTAAILLSSTVIAQYFVFGVNALSKNLWSALDFYKEVRPELLVIERIEAFVLGIWVVIAFIAITNLQFVLVRTICEAFHVKEEQTKYVAWSLFPFFYGGAMVSENISDFFAKFQEHSYVGFIFSIVIPILLFLLAIIRRKRSSPKKKDQKGGENHHATST
ncbi:spore germination protein (amino acid permease) [Croceifilum oryzae]|uniref:Spore germination protein (Amino acid permease) n=1 Tax=Croceifilum oryzae TaxID=1553429 RepID=A0AAJ1WTB6_9BACL|nr:endospore germination permease [Croceifilum oryzae]MDQ0418630.1 spore germination protein (amino acid permease) [Croceifilum oryzae]